MDRRTLLHLLAGAGAASLLPRGWRATTPSLDQYRPYLDAALRAERWLAAQARRDDTGTRWPVVPDAANPQVARSLYAGTAGVALAYLELHAATGDAGFLATARDAARWLARESTAPIEGEEAAGLYTGRAGELWVIARVAQATDDRALRLAAQRGVAVLRAAARPRERGVNWNEVNDIIAGSAGISLAVLALSALLHDDELPPLAGDAARQLLTTPTRVGDRADWPMTASFPRRMPNFSHGTAGVAYALATVGQHLGDPTLLDGARAGARQLEALATPIGTTGRRIFHSTPGNEQLFYLSWCHGPVGTARLFHRLHQIDPRSAAGPMADQLAEGVIASRVPERSPGFWENVSQCCGNAGVVEHFIDRARVLQDPQALAFARRVMDDALGRGERRGEQLRWPQAEHRTQPALREAQTGFMQGAAGLIVTLLHLDGAASGRAPAVILPDSPYDRAAA